jgi:multiple sugar transport system substrate-binding protein
MTIMSRRSVLGSSLALTTAAGLGRPFIANAAAKTATVWVTQGFIPQEDAGFRKMAADYEKASGNKLDLSILPFVALGQKTISALTSGDVPDVISYDAPQGIVPQNAWDDKLVDVTDVVETQKSQLSDTALLSSKYYNSVAKKRSYYLVPYKCAVVPFHIWGSLVEKAGYKMTDIPNRWDAFFDFFKPMQKKLRDQGMRRIYSLGIQLTSVGPNDGYNVFNAFLIANGGRGIVTPDGEQHLNDPKVREAAIKSITYLSNAFKEGYVPPGVFSWNDADDNNAFHQKLILMDFDGTLSTELAMYSDKQVYYHEMVTRGLPNGNDGKPVPAQLGVGGGFIPKGAKNVEVAKDFLKYAIQPKVANEYLKDGLGRWLPVVPSMVKSDPFWLDPSDPHRPVYVREGLLNPTVPDYTAFNPAMAVVLAEQVWGQAEADVLKNGMTPAAAVDKAAKQIESIFDKYRIMQS